MAMDIMVVATNMVITQMPIMAKVIMERVITELVTITATKIDKSRPVLIVMSHIKLGDFILVAPHLKLLMQLRPNVFVAVPSVLFELFNSLNFFPNTVSAADVSNFLNENSFKNPFVLDLTYPLIDNIKVPNENTQLSKVFFQKQQHSTLSYSQALNEYFNEFPANFKPTPYMEFEIDDRLLMSLNLEPFSFFTVHSGSDFAPKNWPAEKYEDLLLSIFKQYPDLKCLEIIGPSDVPLFKGKDVPTQLKSVSTSLKNVASLLSGSLFHIDNDSGIHHLSGALDVPTISLWGPTGPGTWSSLSSKNFIHWGGPNCIEHCGGSKMTTCIEKICLTSIQIKEVLASVENILSFYKPV